LRLLQFREGPRRQQNRMPRVAAKFRLANGGGVAGVKLQQGPQRFQSQMRLVAQHNGPNGDFLFPAAPVGGAENAVESKCSSVIVRPKMAMAVFANKYPDNVAGKYYVDGQCIDCDLCRETAPDNFTRNEDGGYSYVYKHPTSPDEEKLCKLYSLSTLLLGVVVMILLSSLVSGKGINLSAGTFSLGDWISSPGSLLFVVGTLAIGVGLAPVLYSTKPMRKITAPMTLLGIFLSVLSYYLFSSSLVSSWILVPVLLTLAVALLFFMDKTEKAVSNKAVFISILSMTVFSLQFLIYPSAIGRALPIDSVTTAGTMASAFVLITMVGATLLAVMLAFYMTIVAHGRNE
jgi:ferredoxin